MILCSCRGSMRWGWGLQNWSFALCEVCLSCFAWWLVVMAMQLWISFCHVPPFCIWAHTVMQQTMNVTITHFAVPFQQFSYFLVPFFSERKCENTVTSKFFTNWVTRFVWYFPIPSWNHSPVRSEFLAVLFHSFFFLLVTNLLYASSLSSGQVSGFFGSLIFLVTVSSYRRLPQKCHIKYDLCSRYGCCTVFISGPCMQPACY